MCDALHRLLNAKAGDIENLGKVFTIWMEIETKTRLDLLRDVLLGKKIMNRKRMGECEDAILGLRHLAMLGERAKLAGGCDTAKTNADQALIEAELAWAKIKTLQYNPAANGAMEKLPETITEKKAAA